MFKVLKFSAVFILLVLASALGSFLLGDHSVRADWRTASRAPVGIAPDPLIETQAVVQVYGARAYSWRGIFAIHTWIAIKEENATNFTNYEVMGWRVRYGNFAVSASRRAPDSRWFGAEPELIADFRGQEAAALIPRIKEAIRTYPYMDRYVVWPGPNSNTFTAHVARVVPGFDVDLPPTAIGKDFLPDALFAKSPSGTGGQVSLYGLFGVMAGLDEGIEVNILGLSFGIDPTGLALKLPFIGRLSPFDISEDPQPSQ